MPNWRDRYRNPSPPPGFINPDPNIQLQEPSQIIEGVRCEFLGLIIESDVLDDSNPSSDFEFDLSSEDEEIKILPVVKEPPPVIDLEEDEDSSEGILSSSNSSDSNLPAKDSSQTEIPTVSSQTKIHTNASQAKTPVDSSQAKTPKDSTQIKTLNVLSPIKTASCGLSRTKELSTDCSQSKQGKNDNQGLIQVETCTDKVAEKSALTKKESALSLLKKDKKKDSCSNSYSSDNSSHSSRSKKKSKKKKKKRHSNSSGSSCDDSEYEDKKNIVKKEYQYYDYPIKSEGDLFGHWFCQVCSLSMNSEGTYYSHMQGKRHKKAVKQQNIPKAISDSVVNPAAVQSRYPMPPPNVYRIRTKDAAKSQDVIERNVKTPCPGLEKVVEIQGICETTYYCELCDAPCTTNSIVAHLTGHKHQLRCLKYFDPETYEKFRYKKKSEIESRLIRILREVQKRKGLGKLTVEKEYIRKPEKDEYGVGKKDEKLFEPLYRRREEMPGPSYIDPEDEFPECYALTTVPDTSKNDFYCKICDAHMNNQNMWESHIRGKRHLTNLKKKPGEAPSKTRSVQAPNVRPLILDNLVYVQEPVVGLEYIRETQNPEVTGAQYNCFLCGACMTQLDVIDHILTPKHRTKFLEAINHPDMTMLKQLEFQESRMHSIIEEICARVEETSGRGNVEVYITRAAVARW